MHLSFHVVVIVVVVVQKVWIDHADDLCYIQNTFFVLEGVTSAHDILPHPSVNDTTHGWT